MLSAVLDEALRLRDAGLSIIPVVADGSKRPVIAWTPYQSRRATTEELQTWFTGNGVGLAVIGGKVSGGLEVLDFDDPYVFAPWDEMIQELAGSLLDDLPLVQTPTNGRHVYYRCHTTEANQKLAQRLNTEGRPETMVETRGEGGYAILPVSPPACHPLHRPYRLLQGDLAVIPSISPEARTLVLNVARAFSAYVRPEHVRAEGSGAQSSQPTGERPGDVFNARTTWEAILEPHGWTRLGQRGEVTLWKRPGKREPGVSATTNYAGSDLFYCFSSNGAPFEPETAYSKFAAYTLLEHSGDFSASARVLIRLGYGDRRRVSETSRRWPSHITVEVA